jgi:L-asparaginase
MFCGGSRLIGRHDAPLEVRAEADITRWLAEVPELRIIAELEPLFVYDGSGQVISPEIWGRLVQQIKKRYAHYDGFVIMHAFDSMVYTGAALSFMLQNLGKPIILTGAPENIPDDSAAETDLGGFRRLGIRANLINAVQVATMDIAEVCIMFGNRLLRAARTHRNPTDSANIFEFDGEPLGKVDFGIKLNEVRRRRRRTGLLVRAGMTSEVVVAGIHPGMRLQSLLSSIGPKMAGVILPVHAAKYSKQEWSELNRQARQRKLPLFLPGFVERLPAALSYIIPMPPMVEEVTLVKAMWVLGQTNSIGQIRELVTANLADEFLPEPEANA